MTTRSITARRANWHPQVHQTFDEDLYYVVLRFAQPRELDRQVAEILDSARVVSFASYEILGYYDAMVRAWLTPQHWARLRRVLTDRVSKTQDVPAMQYMRVSAMTYLWFRPNGEIQENLLAQGDPELEFRQRVRQQAESIDAVSRAPLRPPQFAVNDLAASGLLLVRDARPAAAIKVFVAFQPLGPFAPSVAKTTKRIIDVLLLNDRLSGSSIYAGDGPLANALVQFTVSSYAEVSELKAVIEEAIEDSTMRAMTLLVASPSPLESDNINNIGALTSEQQRTAELLDLESSALAAVPQTGRSTLTRVTAELADQLAQTSDWETAKSILKACILQDREALRRGLSFVLDFEYYFRLYATRRFSDSFGPDWASKFNELSPEVFRNVPEASKFEPDMWPLGVTHSLLLKCARESNDFGLQVIQDLRSGWEGHVRAVLNLRNEFAHGKLTRQVTRLDDLSSEWGLKVVSLLEALPVYRSLYNLAEGN